MLKCLICSKHYSHLGSHIARLHKMTAKEYKMEYGLNIKHSLITDEIKEKKRKAIKRSPTWRNNFKGSVKYRFKAGRSDKGRYISTEKKRQNLIEIVKYNKNLKPENCPVCNIEYDNMGNHLLLKHKLLRV